MPILLFLAGLFASVLSLRFFAYPYLLIALVWVIIFAIMAIRSASTVAKSVWFNLCCVVVALGCLELYSVLRPNNQAVLARFEGDYRFGYFADNQVLGYAPARGKSVNSRKVVAGEVLYDVTYTINESGLRISSPGPTQSDDCILFFGGSFTFGEGVNDHEAMPYVVQELTGYTVHNFGFHGYGPHQMLAAVQAGLVEDKIDCKPKLIVYQALLEHIARSAGHSSWDRYGPAYQLMPNGSVVFTGPFDSWLAGKLSSAMQKSFFYKKYFANRYRIDQTDVDLYLAIVAEAKRSLQASFPSVEYHVIYWDRPDEEFNEQLINGFRSIGATVSLINQVLPDYSVNTRRYKFGAADGHPNAFAHRRVAEYIAAEIPEEKNPN